MRNNEIYDKFDERGEELTNEFTAITYAIIIYMQFISYNKSEGGVQGTRIIASGHIFHPSHTLPTT